MNNRRCVLIGASPDTDAALLKQELQQDDFIVCADGGMIFARQAGFRPNLIVGDFDSSELPSDPGCEVIRLPVRKDDTDIMYAVKECIRRGFRRFALYGVTGGRPDHTFASLTTLYYLAENGCLATIEDKLYRCFVMKNGTLEITHERGSGLSIFPFGCSECMVTLRGFEYDLQSGILHADFPLGVSNCIISDTATVIVHHGTALVYTTKY